MYGYIYRIDIENTESKHNGKYYIGQRKSNTIEDIYYGSGTLMLRYLKKYGIIGLTKTILAIAESLEELNHLEDMYIGANYMNRDICINLKGGGDCGTYSDESKKKISDETKKAMNTPEIKERQSKGVKKVWEKLEYREKMKNSLSHIYTDPDIKKKHSEAIKKAYSNPETRKKLSNAIKEALSDTKIRQKISDKIKGQKCYNNGIKNIKAFKCPEGFVPGIILKKNIKWYNNGEIAILSDVCPDGFILGCLKKGRHWYNDGVKSIKAESCPEGFVPGLLHKK
jgi:hypothetical protein